VAAGQGDAPARKGEAIAAPALERVRRHLVGPRLPRALEAIDALLAEELAIRETRRIKAARTMARRTTAKTLAGFDFSFQPALGRERIPALARLGLIERNEAVHFLGPPGTGRSQLGVALGVEAVRAGRSVDFATLADIVASLAKAEREGVRREPIRFRTRAALLIVDELGDLPVTPGGGNLLFPLVNARYERGARILASNRGFAEWGEVLGDPVVATARLDRLLHHAVVNPDRGIQLPPASARRPRARACPLQGAHHAAAGPKTAWTAAQAAPAGDCHNLTAILVRLLRPE
jgi:DNA replication protein DnaC